MTDKPITGGCHCGQVRYEIHGEGGNQIHCFCTDCQKIGGAGHNAAWAHKREDIKITGDVKVYARKADSGNVLEVHFCPHCSSPIFNGSQNWPENVMVHVGSLDDPTQFKANYALFDRSRQSWDPRFEGKVFEAMPVRDE